MPKRAIRVPLSLADNDVLNPIIKNIANTISAAVATIPTKFIRLLGTHGLSTLVYSIKLPQLPQAELSSGHHPNRSATADKKPKAILTLRKS